MAVFVKNNRELVTAYLADIFTVDYGDATSAQKTSALQSINDGYHRYLSGEYKDDTGATQVYVWPFVKEVAQITLVTSDDDYDLPDSYEGDVDGYVYDHDNLTGRRQLEVVDHEELLKFRRDDDTGGLPRKYTVRAKTYSASTGSVFEWLCWPVPTSAENGLTITYRYRKALPDLVDSETEYPAGLLGAGDLVLQAAKMQYEQHITSVDGNETARFYRLMAEMARRSKAVVPGRILQDRISLGGRVE